MVQLRTSSGEATPLSAVARIVERRAPLQITHVAQYPATTVGFDTAAGVSLGTAVDAVPLMLGWGEGAELRRPLGLAIFGGLIVSQLLTLFTTPVIYLAFDRLGRRFRGRSKSAAVAPGVAS